MNRAELSQEIVKLFLSVFPAKNEQEIQLLNREHDEDWDSLKHIEIISELEDGFEIELSVEDVDQIKDINSAIDVVLNSLVA